MHTLHHPDRRSVGLVTALAATLAIIVTLVLAASLNGVNSGSASSLRRTSSTVQRSEAAAIHPSKLLTGNSLTGPLGAPIHLPWASTSPFVTAR